SFSLLDHVQMFVKPMPQLLLCRRWELQDKTRKTQSLEDFKIAPRIRNDMRASAASLVKGKGLTRLVRKTGPGLGVGKQMIETVAQHHRQHIKDDRTIARGTE